MLPKVTPVPIEMAAVLIPELHRTISPCAEITVSICAASSDVAGTQSQDECRRNPLQTAVSYS